jgi:hypothetical protein
LATIHTTRKLSSWRRQKRGNKKIDTKGLYAVSNPQFYWIIGLVVGDREFQDVLNPCIDPKCGGFKPSFTYTCWKTRTTEIKATLSQWDKHAEKEL